MTKIDTILTHHGGAHKDEFLACCVLLALHPVPIIRRDPSEAELADPAIAVIDVGNLHDPALSNFDHHQLPRDYVPTCSLSLVLQHLGLYEDARQFCEWLEPAEWFDCRGPGSTAKWLGLERDLLNKLNSPIDVTLLRRFAQARSLEAGNPLWEVMKMIGEDLVHYIKSLRSRLDFLAANAEIWDLELAGKPAQVLFLPRVEPLAEDSSMGMDRYIENIGLSASIVATVYPDRRGEGYGISRYRDNQRVDFTQISSSPKVHFAHARGFVAKTSETDHEALKQLLVASAVPTI